jgi:predicted AlkP superfamily phosphohydrolase/phosphomutase
MVQGRQNQGVVPAGPSRSEVLLDVTNALEAIEDPMDHHVSAMVTLQ